MGYSIKWRFVVKLAIFLIVAAVGIHLIHLWQVRSQAGAFLHQADLARAEAERLEQEKRPQEASTEREREQRFLQRYVLARPDDLDVRERLVRLMCETAKTRRQKFNAFFALEEVLRRDESRDDLRRFTIDFAVKDPLYLFKEAKAHLMHLEDHGKLDGEMEGQYARCFIVERNFEEAEKYFDRSRQHRADLIDSFAGLALMRRQLNDPKKPADHVIHEMLAANPEEARAYLHAVGYMKEFGLLTLEPLDEKVPPFKPKKVPYTQEKLVEVALLKGPNELEPLIAAAEMALVEAHRQRHSTNPDIKSAAEKKTSEARDLLNRAIRFHPHLPNGYLALAALEAESRHFDEALKVVRAGLEKLKDSPDAVKLFRGLMQYQFQAGDVKGAADTLKELTARGLAPGIEEFESARLLILEERWKEAAASLERAVPHFHGDSNAARQAQVLLGRCYEQMGEHERRLRAYTLALPNELGTPLWGAAMLGIAEAEAALGRGDDALKTYRKMTDFFPAVWVPVARLEMLRVMRQSPKQRKWDNVDEALRRAEIAAKYKSRRFIPDPTELKILQATVKHYQGHTPEARKILEELRTAQPKNVTVLIELAMQDLRENQPDKALASLHQTAQEFGDSLDIRLARARALATKKEKDLDGKLIELSVTPQSFSKQQRQRLLRGLADIATTAGAEEATGRLWDELAKARPFDLSVQIICFDRAARAGDVEAMRPIVARITEQEGPNGRMARLTRALLLGTESTKTKNKALRDQALQILDAIEREQLGAPSGRVLIAQGLIHDLNGNTEAAKAKYRQSVERGETNVQAVRRLLELLNASNDQKQIQEARALIQKFENAPELGPDFQRLAAAVSLRADNVEGALKHALKAVSENSTRYQDQMFLGTIYWRSNKPDKLPEPRFRRATELAPEAMEAWLALIQYLLSTGKKDEAAKAFRDAQEKVEPADRALLTALGHAQFGEIDQAVQAFERARKEKPNDIRLLSAEANFLLQLARFAEARASFQRILSLPSLTQPERSAATHGLALATAADPDAKVSKEALKLIGEVPPDGESPAQRRARAVVLGLQRHGKTENRKAAVQLLEENKTGISLGEQFLLAQLYDKLGNATGVSLTMEELLQNPGNRIPHYLRYYASWLLSEGDLSRAAKWIDVLAQVDPDSIRTAELKARLAAARKDFRGAWAILRAKTVAPGAPIAQIAAICESIGLVDEAEQLIKRLVEEKKQTQPRVVLSLAAFHGRRGRTAEGLRICEDMRGKLPLTVVGEVAMNVLYNAASPSPAETERVAGWIDAGLQTTKGPDRAVLFQLLAGIRNLQGRYSDAANLYREALRENQKDIVALNNLAYLLSAAEKKHPDALALIERAKEVVGEHPVLLDTEALIWLNFGQPGKALPLMEIVVAESPSGSAHFHMAQVEDALKHELEAGTSWRLAKDRGLKPGDLHPLERKAYNDMKALYK